MSSSFQPRFDINRQLQPPNSSATKHCIVDLDEAFDRYPPIPPSQFTSSCDSSDENCGPDFKALGFSSSSTCHHNIGVIPEPFESWELEASEGSTWIQNKESAIRRDIHATTKSKSIVREAVLRTRHWGRCMRIPSHLLRPPVISCQRLSD